MQISSIWPIDKTLSGATTFGQGGSGSDGNERVLRIPQSSSNTGTSLSDYLVLYPGHSLRGDAVGVFHSPNQLSKNHLRSTVQ